MSKIKWSIQLYTVRDHLAKDFAGTVQKLAKIGYSAVEVGGAFGDLKTAAEAKKALADAGLTVSGAHVMVDPILADPAKVVADQVEMLGNNLIIVPWIALDGKGVAEYAAFARQMEKAAEILGKSGAMLAYHNHSFEFKPISKGVDGMSTIWGNTSAAMVKAELDMFWVAHGGYDPVKYLEKLAGRVVALHVKDMEVGPDRRFANVGEGIIDYKTVIGAALKAGVSKFAVEQDDCYGQDPLEAAAVSFRNLEKMGLA